MEDDEKLENLRGMITDCIDLAKEIIDQEPKYGREMALVRTKLDEAKMWSLAVWR